MRHWIKGLRVDIWTGYESDSWESAKWAEFMHGI